MGVRADLGIYLPVLEVAMGAKGSTVAMMPDMTSSSARTATEVHHPTFALPRDPMMQADNRSTSDEDDERGSTTSDLTRSFKSDTSCDSKRSLDDNTSFDAPPSSFASQLVIAQPVYKSHRTHD